MVGFEKWVLQAIFAYVFKKIKESFWQYFSSNYIKIKG